MRSLFTGKFRRSFRGGHYLALEFDAGWMTAVEATVSQRSVSVKNYHRTRLPQDAAIPDDPAKAAKWLQQELERAGIKAKRVLLSLPRSAVTLKYFEFADAPEHELPEIVRLQTEAQSSLPPDELCVDYLTLPTREGLAGVDVLTATIPNTLVSNYQELLHHAGRDVVSVGLRPLAVAELVHSQQKKTELNDGANLILDRTDSEVSISLSWKQHVIASHDTRINASDTDKDVALIVGASRRMLAAMKSRLPATGIDKIWLVGQDDEFDSLRSKLAAEFDCDAEIVKPTELTTIVKRDCRFEEMSHDAGPVGMLVQQSSPDFAANAFNFVAPRKAIATPDRRLARSIAVAALTLILVLTGWVYLDGENKRLDHQIRKLTEMEEEQFLVLQKGEAFLESQRLIDLWSASRFVWTDELLAFGKQMPPSDRIYLTSLQLDGQDGSGRGRLKATGYARDREDVMSLNSRLLNGMDRYELQPHGIRPSHRDPHYPSRFEVEVRFDTQDTQDREHE